MTLPMVPDWSGRIASRSPNSVQIAMMTTIIPPAGSESKSTIARIIIVITISGGKHHSIMIRHTIPSRSSGSTDSQRVKSTCSPDPKDYKFRKQ